MAYAQFGRGGPDWTTSRMDAQRTSWIKTDTLISPKTMAKPGFQLLWKMPLANKSTGPYSLSEPIMVGTFIGNRGFKALAIIAGNDNNLFAIDNDLGRPYWDLHWDAPAKPPCASAAIMPSRATPLTAGAGPRGFGRRGPFRGAVGEPGEGAPLDLALGGIMGPPPAGAPKPAPGGPPGLPPGGPPPGFRMGPMPIYFLTSDGVLHFLSQSSGKEILKPLPFLPGPRAVSELTAVDSVVYAAIETDCNGGEPGVWAIDTASDAKTITQWRSAATPVIGPPAFATDGTLFVSTAAGVVALEPKTLREKAKIALTDVTGAPIVVKVRERDVVAVPHAGKVALYDLELTKELGSFGVRATALSAFDNMLLAADETAASGTVTALRVPDNHQLTPAWTSAPMNLPSNAIIVNGVVFTLARGADRGANAVLHALDGATGKPYWSSGRAITSFVRGSRLSASQGQVYVTTADNTLYTFGMPVERQ